MKTLDLITEIRTYVQKLPAKVDMRPYVRVTNEENHIYISYMDSPILMNWEPLTVTFVYDSSLEKKDHKKLGIPAIYRIDLALQLTRADVDERAAKFTDNDNFLEEMSFYLDEEGNMIKTILLPKKLGKGREHIFDYGDDANYGAAITDTDIEYVKKSLTLLRDRIKDYLKEASSTNK